MMGGESKNRRRCYLTLPPTVVAVSAEGFLTRFGFGMIGFALPLYALSLGMGVAEVGFLYGLRTVITLLVKPVIGTWADRFGLKRLLAASVALRSILGLLFVFATEPWHLYAIRLLHGVMTAARDPSASALIAKEGEKGKIASSFAWYLTARDLGSAAGYAAAGLLIQVTGGYRAVFLVAFFASCAALVTVLRYVRESKSLKEGTDTQDCPERAQTGTPLRGDFSFPIPSPVDLSRLFRYASLGLMVSGSAEMMRGLFPIIATQYAGLTEGEAGLTAAVSGVAVMGAGPLFGWLSDRKSRTLALGVRSLANILSSLLYIFFPTFIGFTIARVADDTGKAAFRPAWGALLAELSEADPARRARTMTLVDSGHTLGEALGPLAAGLLLTGFGVPAMLGVRAALSLATEIQAMRVLRKPEPAEAAWRAGYGR